VIDTLVADFNATSPIPLLLVTLLAFLECVVGIGLFVSGAALLSTAIWLHSTNDFSPAIIVIAAFLGAIAGDHLGYFIGSATKPVLSNTRLIRKNQLLVNRITTGLQRSFLLAICVGRLIPVARSLTPALAGAAGLSRNQFHLYDFIACAIWAGGLTLLMIGSGYILPGD
jgi:membrane-associated protein